MIKEYVATSKRELGATVKIRVRQIPPVGKKKVQARPVRRHELLHAPQTISHGPPQKKSIRNITRSSLDTAEMVERKKVAAAPLM